MSKPLDEVQTQKYYDYSLDYDVIDAMAKLLSKEKSINYEQAFAYIHKEENDYFLRRILNDTKRILDDIKYEI